MEKIEQSLKRIKNKDQLHRLIDEMPEGATAVLIADGGFESAFGIQYGVYGEPQASALLWNTERFKRWLFEGDYE